MAKLPIDAEKIIAQYGPSLHMPNKEAIPGRDEPDSIIETHCCFCGMQCGIKLWQKTTKLWVLNLGWNFPLMKEDFVRRGF